MVSELSLWFLYPGFDPRRAQFYFSKNKLTERSLKCACHSVDWMVTEWWLKCDWNPPFPSPFSHHSVDWNVRFHPVFPPAKLKYHINLKTFSRMVTVRSTLYKSAVPLFLSGGWMPLLNYVSCRFLFCRFRMGVSFIVVFKIISTTVSASIFTKGIKALI